MWINKYEVTCGKKKKKIIKYFSELWGKIKKLGKEKKERKKEGRKI